MLFALALALGVGLAAIGVEAQRGTILTNGRNLQIPINHGLPDTPMDFTFCRLRYDNIRRARKSGWGDDYPQADFNFMVRLSELTKTKISRWADGDPGFANVTAMDPDLFQCPYLRMQNAANYDFSPAEVQEIQDGKADAKDNVLKGAPHTAQAVIADAWEHKYSRERAAFPTASQRLHKYWPTVGRVDDAYGDRNLMCACPPWEPQE